jgi:hypothetical protein
MPALDLLEINTLSEDLSEVVEEINIRIREINDYTRSAEDDGGIVRVSEDGLESDEKYLLQTEEASTTDATVTTIDSVEITADRTYSIDTKIVARRTGGGSGSADDGAEYHLRGTFKTVSGTVSQIGATVPHYYAEDQKGWDVDMTISGTNVNIRVTGAASNNITWHAVTHIHWIDS